MPKIWNETIDEHRRAVFEATLDAAAALVAEHGIRSVTMSQIAKQTGIGRATLYKYFADVGAILLAWHERQITRHLEQLVQIREHAREPRERLEAVLTAYAMIIRAIPHESELASNVHRDPHLASAHKRLTKLFRDLIAEGVAAGNVRDDVSPDELAGYCIHALTAAKNLASKDAVRRLVAITTTGLKSTP